MKWIGRLPSPLLPLGGNRSDMCLVRSLVRVLIFSNVSAERRFLESLASGLGREGVEVVLRHGLSGQAAATGQGNDAWSEAYWRDKIRKCLSWLRASVWIVRAPTALVVELVNAIRFSKAANDIIEKVSPDIVLLGTDNTYGSLFVLRAARKRSLVCVIPFSLCNHEELVFSQLQHRARSWAVIIAKWPVVRHLSMRFLGRWAKYQSGQVILCPTRVNVLIQYLFGLVPRDPWLICGGNSDHVLLPSEFEKDYYVKAGVPSEKIVLFQAHEAAVASSDKRPEYDVLWSVPSDFYGNPYFKSYEEFITWHQDVFRKLGLRVLASPHPRSDRMTLERCISGGSVTMDDSPIESLMQPDHLFLAHQSATIRFALAKRMLVINSTIFGFPYTEYRGLPSVREVCSPFGLIRLLILQRRGRLFSTLEGSALDERYFAHQGRLLGSTLRSLAGHTP